MHSVELFAGAGGLAIGMANAGFKHAAVIERNPEACATFRLNQRHHAHAVEGWPLHQLDARRFDYSALGGDVAVVSGGPPCQPFSQAGKHLAHLDDRDMFPEAVRAVRALRPKAFIFENVKGLLRESFKSYFQYILLQLQYPDLERRKWERWARHLARLEQHHTASKHAATYNVVFRSLNAADYGVPQKRERVFMVGFRSDQGLAWSFPDPTHSEAALLHDQWISGDYWERHGFAKKLRTTPPDRLVSRVRNVRSGLDLERRLPWRTVRDAIGDLPDPENNHAHGILNHIYVPGARTYPGHTGSSLDEPSKTLKAGDHGVPGGENMFIRDSGGVRYFTVREAARIQTFPDEFEFQGFWTDIMHQLGNAVPVTLAEVIAKSVARRLGAR